MATRFDPFLSKIRSKDEGAKGDPGDSAYQVAVANGFVGTQAEWLASLEGAVGPQGPAGVDGLNASSYYKLASDFSAVGDGIADDTTALQNALNSLDTRGYGWLDLEGKTYATGKLSLRPNTGIINGTLKLKNTTNDYLISLDGHATRYQTGWYLKNLTLIGNKANNATMPGVVYLYANGTIYDRPTFENINITDFKGFGINFDGNGTTMTIQPRLKFVMIDAQEPTGSTGIKTTTKVYDLSALGVDIGRCETGVYMSGSAKLRLTDVRAWGNTGAGIKLENVVDAVFANCEADKNFGHGVYSWNSTRINFVGSAFSNNSYQDSANEMGFGVNYGTPNSYDGLSIDSSSEVYITGSRFVNESTAYQRYGINSNGGSTAYYDGHTKFHNHATGGYSGTVKSAQNLTRLEFNNGSALDPQTQTRTNLGFYSNEGAGFEFYKYSDATKPGKFAAIYGGATGQGSVGFTHFDGTNFNDRFSLDANGNLTVSGTVNGANLANVHTHSNKTVLDNATASYTTSEQTKLSGIAAGATANSTDATLLSRANHTGSQAISTVTNLQTTLDGKAAASHSHVATTDLTATGTKDSTTFLRGDNTWAVPSGGGSDPFTAKLRLTSDVTNATVTLANVTGLVFTFEANATYAIELYALCTSAVATTGYSFALDTSVAVSNVGLTFFHQLANTGTLSGGSSIADATRTGLSSGVPTAGALVAIMGGGILVTSASIGTAQLQFAPEVAASATVKAGSVMRVMKVV